MKMPVSPVRLHDAPLGERTTLRIGGGAACLIEFDSVEDFVDYAHDAPVPLVLGQGSNVVVSDEGYPGTVVVLRGGDLVLESAGNETVHVTVQAGVPLAGVIELAVLQGLSGVECLVGIPGTTGAAPVQNVGAYGQDVSQTMLRLTAWDWRARRVRSFTTRECGFGYRDSRFKRSQGRFTILTVTFGLRRSRLGEPIRYPQLADELATSLGQRAPLREVAQAVLDIRRRKGMVVDPADPDSRSAGSFFINPALPVRQWRELCDRMSVGVGRVPPELSHSAGLVRTSAAWLIEQAGFTRGQRFGTAALSTKHPLALVARNGTTAADIRSAAVAIAGGVKKVCGVRIHPEPRFIGRFDPWPA